MIFALLMTGLEGLIFCIQAFGCLDKHYLNQVQCPLDIETLDKAAALDLATATP